MEAKKRKKLEKAGWRVGGTVQELLDLTDEEAAMIEIKVKLAAAVRKLRREQRLSQTKLAARMRSTQPRVAKLEQADASTDQMIRSLLALGASRREIGRKLAGG